MQFTFDAMKTVEDCRLAIMEELVVHDGELFEFPAVAGCFAGNENFGEQWRVFEIAEEPAHGVE